MITKKRVYERLKTVMDPELYIDIVSLGLIYDVQVSDITPSHSHVNTDVCVHVTMTLTTPGCPLAPIIDRMVREAIEPLMPGKIEIELVWDPPWMEDMMSEEAKLKTGMI
jgi:metal-sulfur cluster biosynthetic enzyme